MNSFLPKKLFDDEQAAQDTTPAVDPTEELRLQNEELEAKILRLHADIANMQRHNAENSRRQSQEGTRRLLDQMLPAIDALEFALSALPKDIAEHPWCEGLRQFEKLLQKTLTDAGLQKIAVTAGETMFDPQFHEAIGQVEASEDKPSGSITQQYQQGYLFQDNVLRTAKVQVAN